MRRSKYREQRTLVRPIFKGRIPEKDEYQGKVLILKRHVQQFNRDASALCQLLMHFKPGNNHKDEVWQKLIYKDDLPQQLNSTLEDYERLSFFENLINANGVCNTVAAKRFLDRFNKMQRRHRMILLKVAREWIRSRYQNAFERYEVSLPKWAKEKEDWEKAHPELTTAIREQYNSIFEKLEDLARRNPRICSWTKLSSGKDNCEYSGERLRKHQHGPLCKNYLEFLQTARISRRLQQLFERDAQEYIAALRSRKTRQQAFLDRHRSFEEKWLKYLITMNLSEDTVIKKGFLPHCTNWEEECSHNPHTEKCRMYKAHISDFPEEILNLEPIYRKWRTRFLSGPKKPTFRYPSAKEISIGKIFGEGFFQLDLNDSVVRLRLDHMKPGEFLSFAFKPWPKDYDVKPGEVEITSVTIAFFGSRPRLGICFAVKHAQSKFSMSQDEIDFLRSRKYPRPSEDQLFLDEVRRSILNGHTDNSGLRLMTVDLGEKKSAVAVFQERRYLKSELIQHAKGVELSTDKSDNRSNEEKLARKRKGLTHQHVSVHLRMISEGRKKIVELRNGYSRHDYRRLVGHVGFMIRDWAREVSRKLIEVAVRERVDLLIFESMRGFQAPGYDKTGDMDTDKKQKLGFYAYGAVRKKVTEKAVEHGMRTVTVPYMLSSQFCSDCKTRQQDLRKWEDRKKKSEFVCENCDTKLHSDDNAARVLEKVFWGDILLPVKEDELDKKKSNG